MPIYLFKCPKGHTTEKFKQKPYRRVVRYRCAKCGLWAHRDYVGEHSTKGRTLHLDYNNDPISHLSKKRSFRGIWVENLTPKPVYVRTEAQYQKLLKDTHSREKHA